MKKIIVLALFVTCILALSACGGETPTNPTDNADATVEIIDVIVGEYKVVYDITDSTAISIMSEMINDINAAAGVKLQSLNSGNPENELEIEFAVKSGRGASVSVADEVGRYKSESRSAYAIRAVGKKIVISATDNDALKLAAKRFSSMAEQGKLVLESDFDEVVVFDTDAYKKNGEVKKLDAEAIGSSVEVAMITVNGKELVGFEGEKTEYNVAVDNVGIFEVKLETKEPFARVTLSKDGTKTVIKVESINRKNERTYILNPYESISCQVVNKNGADATVTFVFDDGDTSTASFILDEMSPKYPSLKGSFGLVTNKLATLDIVTNPDGTKEYAKDADGFYTYTKNDGVWSFWENAVKNKNFELVSHTHTHKYWGEDDGGGKFEYYNTAGEKFTSEELPKGSVSAEFVASKQIIQDLDPGQLAVTFVRSGLTAGGKNVAYSATFWDPILDCGEYIGARGTYTYPDKPRDMVNIFSEFDDMAVRSKIKSYMVQHYNTNPNVKTTQSDSGPKECLDAGIPYWTNYIDTAVEMKGWAAFCIHTIKPDTYDKRSGHYIFQSQADELFEHTQKLADQNKVWIATLSEGMIYANEWSTSSVQAYVDGEKIVVSLDCKEEGAVYNMPLTVKVKLPAGKTAATVGGKVLKSINENGATYVLVDVAPKASVEISVK